MWDHRIIIANLTNCRQPRQQTIPPYRMLLNQTQPGNETTIYDVSPKTEQWSMNGWSKICINLLISLMMLTTTTTNNGIAGFLSGCHFSWDFWKKRQQLRRVARKEDIKETFGDNQQKNTLVVNGSQKWSKASSGGGKIMTMLTK